MLLQWQNEENLHNLLIESGFYDINHSYFFVLGYFIRIGKMKLSLDYSYNRRNLKNISEGYLSRDVGKDFTLFKVLGLNCDYTFSRKLYGKLSLFNATVANNLNIESQPESQKIAFDAYLNLASPIYKDNLYIGFTIERSSKLIPEDLTKYVQAQNTISIGINGKI